MNNLKEYIHIYKEMGPDIQHLYLYNILNLINILTASVSHTQIFVAGLCR